MRFDQKDPPRVFQVGLGGVFHLSDCGTVHLAPDEQVTFQTESGAEYDLARKDFGYYATPSLNGRLEQFGLRAVLIKNRQNRYYILLVERGKEPLFNEYLAIESLHVVCWMDSTEALEALDAAVTGAGVSQE